MRVDQKFDAVVIGGGPAGSTAALTLARAGMKVMLAEAVATVPFKIGESLPPAAHPILRDLGLASRIAGAGHLPCPGTVAVWGTDGPTEHDFIRDLHGHGWHLDRPRFDADLRTAAAEAGAEVRLDCGFDRWRKASREGGWELRFQQRGATVAASTPWVVDATGRRALIANARGAPSLREDALVAFCAVVPVPAGSADARTLIESTEEGWWYSALLPGDRRIVVFFTDDDLPVVQEVREPAGFARRLATTRHVGRPTGAVTPTTLGRIRRFPAGSVGRRAFGGVDWIAVGDASLAFDPLSSQGIFHALYTGLRGAQTVVACAGGKPEAMRGWDDRLREIHSAYRRHLAQCYGVERRWPGAPFWERRRRGSVGNTTSDAAVAGGELVAGLA